ncbi:MAG: S8 family serine peptidase [Anaerolineae bacterium]
MRDIRRMAWVSCLLCLLFGIVWGCAPPTAPPGPPVATEPPGPSVVTTPAQEGISVPGPTLSEARLEMIQRECMDRSNRGRAEQAKIPEGKELVYPPFLGLIYIEDQVIVSGSSKDIDALFTRIPDLALEQLATIELDAETSISQFQIGNGKTVEQVVCEINEISAETRSTIFADPNYHISPAGWDGAGSPWTQNGQWTGLPGGGLAGAPATDFRTQWALGDAGIKLFDNTGNRLIEFKGDGIRIAVFDSSPFEEVGGNDKCVGCFRFHELMGDVFGDSIAAEPPLTVWHYTPASAPTCPGPDRKDAGLDRETQDISNHGLFVAGLAHAIAPHSEIQLIRVLEKDGCGDLFTIERAIDAFVNETLEEGGNTLHGTVLNLSLGVHQPECPTRFGLPEEVKSLQLAVQKAVDHGGVVVAAAGNDSADEQGNRILPPLSMEIPADETAVIGVAASNIKRARGCFSNAGDVAAPGGDGDQPCRIPACGPEHPEACLISVARNSATRYVYWVGTSFATPLVSGLAALTLQESDLRGCNLSPAQVAHAIYAGAANPVGSPFLGAGVVNLPGTLLPANVCPP